MSNISTLQFLCIICSQYKSQTIYETIYGVWVVYFFSCFYTPPSHCAGGTHPTGMHSCLLICVKSATEQYIMMLQYSIIFMYLFTMIFTRHYHDGQIREWATEDSVLSKLQLLLLLLQHHTANTLQATTQKDQKVQLQEKWKKDKKGDESSLGPAVQINRFWPLNMSTVHGYLNPWYAVLIADPPSPETLNQYSKTCLVRYLHWTASCFNE